MTQNDDFEDMLDDWLQLIDRDLALEGKSVASRPLDAARNFVRIAIKKIRIGDVESEPGTFLDYFGTEWFKFLFARTTAWYRGRYGDALDDHPERTLKGCVLILDTPFTLRVPIVTNQAGEPGETIWIHYPNEVEDGEDALDWIEKGPNMASLSRGEGLKARRLAEEVATAIRVIHTSLATVEQTSNRIGQLRDAVLPHLDSAAVKIARGRLEDLKHAHWEMQMACELSFKLLTEQRVGSFEQSHDLYFLYGKLPGPVPFKRAWLVNMPNWDVMAQWRYGSGPAITVAETFSHYRTMLRIVQANAKAAKRKISIGGASIEIRRAPFLHHDPAMFEPRQRPPAD